MISVGTAAEMLGVHTDTLVRWDRSGVLPALKTRGGHRRYRIEDIQAVMNGDWRHMKKGILEVSTALLKQALSLPSTTDILGVWYDPRTDLVQLQVSDPSLVETPEGATLPKIMIRHELSLPEDNPSQR